MSEDPVVARISRHLESIDDATLLLLKSQLLVEQQINAALQKILPGAAALDIGRLTFRQRIQIVRALDVNKKAEDGLRLAERLDSIRNRMAHQLEPAGIDDALAAFVDEFATAAPTRFEGATPLNVRMVMCIAYICSVLHTFENATSIRIKI